MRKQIGIIIKNNYKLNTVLFLLLFITTQSTFSQVTITGGTTATAGSPYSTLSGAINALNAGGALTAPVFVNVPAGFTETLTAPIILTASGTLANPIRIAKSGAGANPIITAHTGLGTNISNSTATWDGIFIMVGADFVTLDGLNFTDPNTTYATEMEIGIGLFKTSATDGCNNDSIKNCTVTMQNLGAITSQCISSLNLAWGANTTQLTISAASGQSSNNVFINNTTIGGGIAMTINGYNDATLAFNDVNNKVLNNNISGFTTTGSALTTGSIGVLVQGQNNFTVDGNTINANNPVKHSGHVEGVWFQTGGSGIISNNIISVSCGSLAQFMYGIRIQAGLSSSTINILNNTIQNSTYSTLTTTTASGFFGIQATSIMTGATIGNLNINYNKITGNNIGGASTTVPIEYLIAVNGGTVTNLNIIGDTITNNTLGISTSACTGNLAGVFVNGVTSTNVNIRENVIDGLTRNSTTGASNYGINCISGSTTNYIKKNIIKNIIQNGSGATSTIYGIYLGATADLQVDSNIINNLTCNKTASTSTIYGINQATASATLEKYRYNSISGLSSLGTNTIAGMYFTTSTGAREISYDTISNITTLGGATNYGILAGGATSTINNNTIYNIGSTGTGATSVSAGINISSGSADIFNNMISDIRANATSTAVKAAVGIIVGSATASSVRYNTIYLNNSQGTVLAANACATGVSIEVGNTITLNLQNNIINNQYVASGTGISSAIRRSSAGTNGNHLTNVTFGSNIYYVQNGTNNYIYAEGNSNASNTNSYFISGVTPSASNIADPNFNTSCGLYKIWNADANSYKENALTGTAPIYTPASTSLAQNGAIPVATIVNDYANAVRSSTPDIGALEFTGTYIDIVPPTITYTASTLLPSTTTCNPTISIPITDATGVNTTVGTKPRIYFKKGGVTPNLNVLPSTNTNTSDGWKWVEATNTTSPFSFTIDYSLLFGGVAVNDSITYFVIAQDISSSINVSNNTTAFASGFCPTSVDLSSGAFPVSTPINGYKILNYPTSVSSTATNTAICVSGTTTLGLSATGGTASGLVYQWQSSVAGANSFTDISGATSAIYTTGTLTSSTDFRCVIKDCNNVPITASPSTLVNVAVNSPSMISATSGSRCGTGSVALTAVGSTGTTLNWYAASTGGSILGTGTTYNTPSISSTTNYYVGASISGCVSSRLLATATINSIPNITATGTSTICSGTSTALNATSTDLTLTYVWNPGALSGASQTVIPTATTIFTVTATNTPGCTISSTILKTVNPITNGTFTSTPTSLCLGQTASLNSTINLVCQGSTSGFQGMYLPANWTLVQSNSNGTVNVAGAPSSIILTSGTNSSNLDGTTTYKIIVGCSGIVSFNWSYFTTDFASFDYPKYQINNGTSTIFPGYSTSGASSQSGTASINVNAGDTLKLQSYTLDNDAIACSITISNFSAPAAPVSATVSIWDALTGGNNLGAQPLSITPTTTGNKTYYAEYTTIGSGCVNPVRTLLNVMVNSLPIVTASTSATPICAGHAVTLNGGGATSYVWNNSVTNNTAFNPTTTATYQVTGTDANSCSSVSTVQVVVNSLPIVTASTSATPICAGHAVTLNGGGATSYVWNNSVTNNTAFNPTTTATYQVTGTDANSCSSVSTVQVVVNSLPTVTASTSATPICAGHAVTLNGGGATSYVWNNSVTNNTAFNPTATATYQVTGTDANSCSSVSTVQVVVNSLPIVTASTSATPICAGHAVTLNGGGATSYVWNNSVTNNTAFNPTATATYQVTGTDANSCSSVSTVQVVVNSLPIVTASTSATPICAGHAVTLNGGGAASYVWNNSVINNTAFNPTSTATYQVTGTDANSCTSVSTVQVVVNSLPAVTASASITNLCSGQTVILNGGGANSYVWNNSVINNTAFNPTSTATYQVTGTDANSCSSVSTVQVVVNSLPIVTASTSATPICAGHAVTLNGGGAASYVWNNSVINNTAFNPTSTATYQVTGTDANSCTSVSTVQVVVNSLPAVTASASITNLCSGQTVILNGGGANSYVWNNSVINNTAFNPTSTATYQVTGTDANSCSSVSTVQVVVNSLPIVTASTSATPICAGHAVTLNGGGAASYVWNNSVINNTAFNPTSTATYQVTGTDANSCTSVSTVQVVVNSLPAVTASASITNLCSGQTVILNGGGANSYVWNNSVINNTAFNPTSTATYQVTGTDANSCTSVSTVQVVVNSLPAVTASASITNLCSGQTVILNGGGANSYVWNNSVTNNTAFNPTATTTYQVIGTDANSCTSISTVTVNYNAGDILAQSTGGSNTSSTSGSTCVTSLQTDGTSLNYYGAGTCNIIATITDASAGNVLGSVNVCVNVDAIVQTYNGQPYVARHYDITPSSNGPATVTLYYTADDFVDYNASAGTYPQLLPSAGTAAAPANGATMTVCISQITSGGLGVGALEALHTTIATWNEVAHRWEVTIPVTGFSGFYCHACNPNGSALPVTITDFHGQKSTNSNLIYWTTTNENNSNYFNLLYSTNGKEYSLLKKINSKAINGSSSETINYYFEHEKPTLGHNYYKLEQVDIDGKTTINTNIIDLNWGSNGSTISIYPNPISDELNIDIYTSKVENSNVKILDMSGRVIKETNSKLQIGANNLKLTLNELSFGIYTVQILENNIITQISKVEKK